MTAITPFQFPATGQAVRTMMRGDQPWFVGRDACAVLDIADARASLNLLDEDERDSVPVTDALGRQQSTIVITESGLYSLILRSRKPEAKAFKRWITHEVLPAIRQTGGYGAPAIPDMSTSTGRLQILDMAVKAEQRALAAENRIAELEPEAARAHRMTDTDGLALVGSVAKRFGIGERALFAFLRAEKLLITGGEKHNEPYAKYIASKHFDVKVNLVVTNPDRPMQERSTPMVTPKGEALIWKRLFAAGLVPSSTLPGEQLALTGGQ